MELKVTLYFWLAIFSSVDSWTVNIAEMKVISEDKKTENSINFKNGAKKDKKPDVMENFKYAEGFEYQGYKEAKVSNVIRSGSIYLEGLSRALLDYRQTLETCRGHNSSNSNHTELRQSCSTASEDGELIQKLSELALETTRKLRDKTNEMNTDGQSEENELLLQLAWFLEQLARLTGYKQFDSNVTDTTTTTEQTTPVTKTKDSSLELLETVENGRAMSKLPPKVKTVVKRSTSMADVVKYYTKYKVWTGSNSYDSNSNYDVKNDIARSRRSLPNKKYVYLRVSKKKISNVKNMRGLMKKPNVFKVVVIKKLNKKY